MKELIGQIIREVADFLDKSQVQRLEIILKEKLSRCNDRKSGKLDLVKMFIEAKKIEGCSVKTLNYYETSIQHLLAFIGKKPEELTTDDIRKYLYAYREERKTSRITVDNLRRIYSSFFAWLEEEDYILKSPVRRIHKVKTEINVKETYTDENLEILRDSYTEIRDLAITDMLASTGMRIGEMVLLNREDIDFNERECIVLGKGAKERVVYFDARTKIHLQNYLDSRVDENPALFVSLKYPHKRLTISGIEVRLRKAGLRLGMNRVHPHKFRRTLLQRLSTKVCP